MAKKLSNQCLAALAAHFRELGYEATAHREHINVRAPNGAGAVIRLVADVLSGWVWGAGRKQRLLGKYWLSDPESVPGLQDEVERALRLPPAEPSRQTEWELWVCLDAENNNFMDGNANPAISKPDMTAQYRLRAHRATVWFSKQDILDSHSGRTQAVRDLGDRIEVDKYSKLYEKQHLTRLVYVKLGSHTFLELPETP